MTYASEIRGMTAVEIVDAIEQAKAELFNLRFQWSTGQLADPNRIRIVKRDIARYKTILREWELAAELIKQQENSNA